MRHERSNIVLAAVVLGWLGAPSLAQAPLATQTDTQGPVTIAVKPIALSASAPTLRFEIVQDTHSAALTQDLREAAVLAGPPGSEAKPVAWQGDPPGGHHRKGVLDFTPISPMPESVTLTIRGIGGVPERTFTWAVPK